MYKHQIALKVTGMSSEDIALMIDALHTLATNMLGPAKNRWGIVTDGHSAIVLTAQRGKDAKRLEKVVLLAAECR